uniref:Uncharacterized protein n=1 Tax=Romanomermis culicivorax TaxID=13658 RepID=A0A915JVP6_ROMCU
MLKKNKRKRIRRTEQYKDKEVKAKTKTKSKPQEPLSFSHADDVLAISKCKQLCSRKPKILKNGKTILDKYVKKQYKITTSSDSASDGPTKRRSEELNFQNQSAKRGREN